MVSVREGDKGAQVLPKESEKKEKKYVIVEY